jgi:hypothetical protein
MFKKDKQINQFNPVNPFILWYVSYNRALNEITGWEEFV